MKTLENYSQPYLYLQDKNINLLCCYCKESVIDTFAGEEYSINPWKIHNISNIKEGFNSSRLELPEYINGYGRVFVECNPCVYSDNNLMTYTCGFKQNPQSAVHYYVVSVDNKYRRINVLHRAFNGVLHKGNLYSTSKKNIDIIDIKNNKIISTHNIIKDESTILRITKIFGTNEFIITACRKQGNYSIWLDEDLNIKQKIKANNKDIYKCSIYKNYLAYTTAEPYTEKRSIILVNR